MIPSQLCYLPVLKQGDSLSPILFNLASEPIIRAAKNVMECIYLARKR